MLSVHPDAHAAMVAHALRGLPDEACGLMVGSLENATVERFEPCGNLAASSKLYLIDPKDHLRIDRAAENEGLDIVGVMHSHTHTEAYPSLTDVEAAPDPAWHYVIVSLRQDAPVLRSFRIVDGGIDEVPVVVDGAEFPTM